MSQYTHRNYEQSESESWSNRDLKLGDVNTYDEEKLKTGFKLYSYCQFHGTRPIFRVIQFGMTFVQ